MENTSYLVVSLPRATNSQAFLERLLCEGKQPVAPVPLPDFQIRTLDLLVQVSEELAKVDGQVGACVAKVVDVLKAVGCRERFVGGQSPVAYVEHFAWNTVKYRVDKPIKELVELVLGEAFALDNDVRTLYQQFQTAKSNLAAADRKKNGDLSVKLLHELVRPDDFVLDLEHLTTVLVAVPKLLVSDFLKSYETLTQFVIPRSAREIAADSEYVLYAVSLFKKYQNAFVAALRERKWHPRTDFEYLEEKMAAMRAELDTTQTVEARARSDVLRLAKTAYLDVFAAWMHIKAIRIYVESVLRYGLPPQFDTSVVRFEPGSDVDRARKELVAKFGYLGGEAFGDANLHEYSTLVDTEYEPFVLYHLEIV